MNWFKPRTDVRWAWAGLFLLQGLTLLAAMPERVYITEFMAANTRTLTDRDRQYSDWIEIFNAGTAPVNLEGWSLTDERANLKKWRFPATTLPPSEYLIVFASKKDRRVPNGE